MMMPPILIMILQLMVGASGEHYCADNEFFPGTWRSEQEMMRWVPESKPGCHMANETGRAALEALRGTTMLFFGDSILRQLFHGLVHGVIRDMPTIVDPVFGAASFTAVLPEGKVPRDALVTIGKDGSSTAVRKLLGDSPLQGWRAGRDVQLVFSFLNNCPAVVETLDLLKRRPEPTTAYPRRVVFVTNIGASNGQSV